MDDVSIRDRALSIEEVASRLNVSTAWVHRQVVDGALAARAVNGALVISEAYCSEWKRQDDARRLAIAAELTAEGQRLGLYD